MQLINYDVYIIMLTLRYNNQLLFDEYIDDYNFRTYISNSDFGVKSSFQLQFRTWWFSLLARDIFYHNERIKYATDKTKRRENTTGLISVAVAGRRRITYSFVISFSIAERNEEGNKFERREQKKNEEIERRTERSSEIVKDPLEVGMRVHEIRFRFRGH